MVKKLIKYKKIIIMILKFLIYLTVIIMHYSLYEVMIKVKKINYQDIENCYIIKIFNQKINSNY